MSQVDKIFPHFRSGSNSHRRTINLAPESRELSVPTIKQGARLAVGGAVMVDERGQFRELILKPRMVDRVRRSTPDGLFVVGRTAPSSKQAAKNRPIDADSS